MKRINDYHREPARSGAKCQCVTGKGHQCVKPAQVKIVPDAGGPWILLCNVHCDFSHRLLRANKALRLIDDQFMVATRKDGSGRTRTSQPGKVLAQTGRKLSE